MHINKLFSIEDSLNWYKLTGSRLSTGDVVKTNKKYFSGDNDAWVCKIISIIIKEQNLNEALTKEGYTHEEIYKVLNLETGKETVLWPEECILLTNVIYTGK